MKNTSDRIKEAMELRNLRQSDLVEITGISKGSLSSYISGKYIPKQTNIYKIAKALEVDVAWLMGYNEPMNPQTKPVEASNCEIETLINILRNDSKMQKVLNYYNTLNEPNKEMVEHLLSELPKRCGARDL